MADPQEDPIPPGAVQGDCCFCGQLHLIDEDFGLCASCLSRVRGSKVRVLRILEYTYSNAEHMITDMSHWQIGPHATKHVGNTGSLTIKSATMLPETQENPDHG